jgi:signal transduction histidine kinase
MHVDDLRSLEIFEGLTDLQLTELIELASEVPVEPGIVLWREGERADVWWVLLEGEMELFRHVGREDTVVGKMVPGRWAGGMRAWDVEGVYLASGRGVTEGRILRVPSEVLRHLTRSWLPFAAHLIGGLYHTARHIESVARERSSLVALGTLAAGFAHEINNPAAATTRAVAAMEESTETLLAELGRLAHADITARQFARLDALRLELAAATPVRDPIARADREQELDTWLSRRGVDQAWQLAAELAAEGADEPWCERVEETLPGPELQAGLKWVVSTLMMRGLLAEVKESSRRISELVGAIRSYTQMDRASLQSTDVTEGIESTLVMLSHKLGDGITVERDYSADLPHIQAYTGELNQVWTNLIDNAIDAMDGAGTLRISTASDAEEVVVEVADTGPGMPLDVVSRAFEAFYTTKDVGKGTGLGLDIARRIVVERHGGTITIDSRPGRTVLRVGLPRRPGNS